MTKTEKMQKLHLAKAQGAILSAEDAAELQNWYDALDREEAVINRDNRPVEVAALERTIERTTARIQDLSGEIAAQLAFNEQIRQENQALRFQIEARLAKQAA